MPLHRCLYPIIKENIRATYEWLEEKAKVTVLHTDQAITVGTAWSKAISYTATSSRQRAAHNKQ